MDNEDTINRDELTHYGPVTKRDDGSLGQLVQQVSDSSPHYDQQSRTYTVKYKGPYEILKDKIKLLPGCELSKAIERIGLTEVKRYPHPTLNKDEAWLVRSAQLQELDAGAHAILTITCDMTTGDGDGTQKDDPTQDVWNLRWESYTMKPYGFSQNAGDGIYLNNKDMINKDIELQKSSRTRVEQFLNGKDHGEDGGNHWYRDDIGEAKWLNYKDELLLRKVLEDKSALYHYPVLSHTRVREFHGKLSSTIDDLLSTNWNYGDEIGNNLDTIIDTSKDRELSGCPYEFPPGKWTWVKIGDDMTHTKSKTQRKVSFQRVETFMGVISADVNYYGKTPYNPSDPDNTRWTPGCL